MSSWTTAETAVPLITASAILAAGVIDDLRSKKFHNWLFVICSVVALAVVTTLSGTTGLYFAVIGFAAGIVTMLPLVLMGILGAGDMKLLAAFGIVAGWDAVVSVAIFSLIWGAIFGLVRVAVSGELKATLTNMLTIATLKERSGLELHRIPFAVALLMGWLTHLVYQGVV